MDLLSGFKWTSYPVIEPPPETLAGVPISCYHSFKREGKVRSSLGLFFAIVVALFEVTPVRAACDEDSLETVSNEGDILIMLSGQVYQVQAGGEVDSQLWLPTEDVLICGDTIINKDENGEEVEVTRIK